MSMRFRCKQRQFVVVVTAGLVAAAPVILLKVVLSPLKTPIVLRFCLHRPTIVLMIILVPSKSMLKEVMLAQEVSFLNVARMDQNHH